MGAPLGGMSVSERPSPRETVRLLVEAARSDDLGFLAAAIAFYAFVSMVPLVILALATASLVGGAAFAAAVSQALADVLTPETLEIVQTALEGDGGRGGATLVGLVVLAWSGLRLFRGLHTAVSIIYGTAGSTSIVGELRNAVVTLGAIGVGIAVLAGVLAVLGPGGLLTPIATALLLPIAFFPVYYVLPDVSVSPLEAVPGAVLAGLGWTVLGWLFSLYTAYAAGVSVYGAVGVVLLALTWFYAGALLVLLGAILNAVLAGRADNRQLQQVAGRDPS